MKHLFLFSFLLGALNAQAQKRHHTHFWELGVMAGITNYTGDVARTPVELSEMRPGYGVFVRHHFSPNFSVKGHLYSGSLSGDDKHSSSLRDRSFRFSTSILELGAVAEWNIFGKDRISRTGMHVFHISPYLFAGAAAVQIDADAEYYGPADKRNDYLKVPLPETESAERVFTTPIGGGIRMDLYDRLIIAGEGGLRPAFSDRLDGISLNGNPDSNDWYYFAGLTVSYILNDPYR